MMQYGHAHIHGVFYHNKTKSHVLETPDDAVWPHIHGILYHNTTKSQVLKTLGLLS